MTSSEIRQRFLKFFEKRGHAVISSASLVTSDDKGVTNSTLFNTAGMQPLVPYLLGETHPAGKRLVDVQKCLRTIDIDDIGDKTHATFFEMLGNWSLGDYFKEDAIRWSYEFLISREEGLGLDPRRLYVTIFEGDENAQKDRQSAEIWEKIGVPRDRIYFKGADSNWWPAVKKGMTPSVGGWTGPTGPCSEMFYDVTVDGLGDLTTKEFIKADEEQKVVEIWNDVFMEYEKKDGEIVGRLRQKNVDTGAGFERLVMIMQGVDNIYDTDLLSPIMKVTKTLSDNIRSQRIVADHIRSAIFLSADGVIPSNTDRGYILRRLIRRAIFNTTEHRLTGDSINRFVDIINDVYIDTYEEISKNNSKIKRELLQESEKFASAVGHGIKELEKIMDRDITGMEAFTLFSSYGLPIDMINEIVKKKGNTVDVADFEVEFKKHQELSRAGAEQKFKGGLADTDEMTIRYHTATHLLHQALQDVLGTGVMQRGSNITPERLRFDFSHDKRMTDEEKEKVEEIINQKIEQALPVNQITLSREEAEKTGARHLFGEKYGDDVSIYFIGQELQTAYSKEFCGGPHVKNTAELAGPEGKWRFKIQKEEAVSQGVRRVRAVLI